MSNSLGFRHDVTVDLVKSSAQDSDVVFAARVSTAGEASKDSAGKETSKRDEGLINYLMKNRHGSPFEHSSFTFYIEAPIFVFREMMRHRMSSFNESSGRYRELEPVFYVPSEDRNLIQEGKAGEYVFLPGSDTQFRETVSVISNVSKVANDAYHELLENGIAREVARMVLPLNIYSSMYMTVNARSLMNFLSLRRKSPDSAYPSFPQREIEMVAEKMEDIFAEKMPATHAGFVKNGRVSP